MPHPITRTAVFTAPSEYLIPHPAVSAPNQCASPAGVCLLPAHSQGLLIISAVGEAVAWQRCNYCLSVQPPAYPQLKAAARKLQRTATNGSARG